MDIQLIPYGKATTFTNSDGSFRFDCQHGPSECEANTYHACVIEVVQDALARLEVVACMILDNHAPKEAFHKVLHIYIYNTCSWNILFIFIVTISIKLVCQTAQY